MTGAGRGPTLPRFSLVVCSINRARLDECVARYRAAFADEAFDLIVIDDAKSLAEAYNRGIASARGANIVFSHDDASRSPDAGLSAGPRRVVADRQQ